MQRTGCSELLRCHKVYAEKGLQCPPKHEVFGKVRIGGVRLGGDEEGHAPRQALTALHLPNAGRGDATAILQPFEGGE